MKAAYIVILIAGAWGMAFAQDPYAEVAALLPQEHAAQRAPIHPLTLADLETAALQGNPDIRVAARRMAMLEARQPAAGALDDPQFMYRGWGVPLRQPWNLNQAMNMFMVSQTLPGAGKRGLRSEIAGEEIEVARAGLEVVRHEVRVQVRRAYYRLLRHYDQLRVHDEHVALARQAVEAARIKYVVGRVPQQDVLKAQIALTRLADHLVQLEQEGELARTDLNALLGRNAGQAMEVAGAYELPDGLPTLAELGPLAEENRPELAVAARAVRREQARARLAEKAYAPDTTLAAGYMLQPDGSRFRSTYMAEFSLNLPWLNRRKHEAEIAGARVELSVQEAEYESRRVMVLRQIQAALSRANAARRLVAIYRDTMRPQARAVMKAASAAYETDRTDFLNLLDSQTTALDVEFSYFQALGTLEERLADLERAVGVPPPGVF
ncbi:MAG: TolC family protein, partial [Terriglobales bacterium]